MDLERYYELRTILQQWKKRLADSIRGRIVDSAHWLEHLREIYASEGTEEAFTEWLDRWCRQAAIQFILRVLFLRVLEDRDLLGVTRIRTTDGQRMWSQLTRNLGAAGYVQWCCWDAAHLLPDLFGPTEYDLVLPDDDLVQRFLDDVWRRPDPNREGRLRFDFCPDPARGDEGFETRFIGDLYQELDAEIRDRYALLQTHPCISQFILDQTLLRRFEKKDFQEVTLMDPACGSGHFVLDAFWMFVSRYEEASGKRYDELSVAERTQIARTVIEEHLYGCDINPYATALARFRLVLAACDYAEPTSLRNFRDLRFNLATIDSLIPYERLMVSALQAGGDVSKLLGRPSAIKDALPVLRGKYDVIVGNPPYITPNDPQKRVLYSQRFFKGYYARGVHLSALFMVRVFQLSQAEGYIGLIVDNAFAIKRFGEKWVKRLLPRKDLLAVYDLSGLSIPGHGTPTLLLFMRNASQTESFVDFAYCRKGDRRQRVEDSPLWQELVDSQGLGSFSGEFIERSPVSVEKFHDHPWPLDIRIDRLYDHIKEGLAYQLKDVIIQRIGSMIVTRCDPAFLLPDQLLRRCGIPSTTIRRVLYGEISRDWVYLRNEHILFPYDHGCSVIDRDHSAWQPTTELLRPLKPALESRRAFGRTQIEAGRKWFEYNMLMSRQLERPYLVAYPAVTTSHNHFNLLPAKGIAHHSLQVFTLKPEYDRLRGVVLAVLNSSLGCFCLKREGAPKRQEDDPVKSYYDFDGTSVGRFPLAQTLLTPGQTSARLTDHEKELSKLADRLTTLAAAKSFDQEAEAYQTWNSALDGYVAPHPDLPPPFTTARELRAARSKLVALRQDIRDRMIFLQEEMDWLAYEMYGLLKSKAPLAEDYLSRADYEAARLELGQRPFEVAGKGYQDDWPVGYEPAPLPEALRPLTEARMAIIEANPDIALLEDPLYKRRWIPPDYDQEFRDAAEWWLAEKLEWALEQHCQPISLRQWARLLGRDERVTATLEVLTDTQMYDLDEELLKVIRANAVPDRAEHYLKPEGLRKFYAARQSHPPGTPEYKSAEFGDGTAWKLRGKLNIPRERFISYAEFDHTQRGVDAPDSGGPWFGWAGWDPAQRAVALIHLIEQASKAGWEIYWRQCGIRAALRDLLPELEDLPAADRTEFEAIAGMCGIGLGTACYCQAYRDGIARGEPGVPGVDAEVLGVKVVAAEGKGSKRGGKRKMGDVEVEQLGLDL